jgi:hypothetical protein
MMNVEQSQIKAEEAAIEHELHDLGGGNDTAEKLKKNEKKLSKKEKKLLEKV